MPGSAPARVPLQEGLWGADPRHAVGRGVQLLLGWSRATRGSGRFRLFPDVGTSAQGFPRHGKLGTETRGKPGTGKACRCYSVCFRRCELPRGKRRAPSSRASPGRPFLLASQGARPVALWGLRPGQGPATALAEVALGDSLHGQGRRPPVSLLVLSFYNHVIKAIKRRLLSCSALQQD